jgi:hypothetical protein
MRPLTSFGLADADPYNFLQMNFTDEPVYFMRQFYLLILVSLTVLIANFGGQCVTSMSEELSEAAYGSLWYEQDMQFKKDFKAFLIYLDDGIVFEIKGIFRVDLEYFVIVSRPRHKTYRILNIHQNWLNS